MEYDSRLDAVIDQYVQVRIGVNHKHMWICGHVRRLELPAHDRVLYQLQTVTGFVELKPEEVEEVKRL